MSEQARKALGTILEGGFQVETDAFKTLIDLAGQEALDQLVKEVLRLAVTTELRPVSLALLEPSTISCTISGTDSRK